jgi:hypothetical protein
LSVSIIFLGFVPVVELISSQFLHLFLSRFVCFGCLFLKGAWETNHSQPPNPQSLFLEPIHIIWPLRPQGRGLGAV